MSVDPSTLVATLGAAVGALVLGVDSETTPDQAAAVTQVVEQGANQVAEGVNAAIATLPEGSRGPVEQIVTEAVDRLRADVETHLPDEARTESEDTPEPDPGVESGPETSHAAEQPASSVPRTSVWTNHAITPAPAVLPFTSSAADAPIGALAVFAPWLKKAGEVCDGIDAPILAALYSAENGFRYGPGAPVSPAGALGPGQFMPGTWATYGRDEDGDGTADVLGVADPVMASGRLLCDSWSLIDQWKDEGRVAGDTLSLTLAAYNAGAGAVLRSGGMPSGHPDYENQTKPYVARILATRLSFESLLAPFIEIEPRTGDGAVGQRILDQAFRHLGLPYVWGGGNIQGPTGGGFDCSGLTSFALHAAAGIVLPRTSETQWGVGVEVPLDQARPGDLVFGNWQAAGPGHVGIYLGGGMMVHAPTTGDVVRIGEVFTDMRARRIV